MLDLLAGRKTSGASGEVRLNGHLSRPEIISKYISYVSQVRPRLPSAAASLRCSGPERTADWPAASAVC